MSHQMIDEMFKAGVHYGLGRNKRHPSVSKYIFGLKNNVEIIDIEKTLPLFEKAKEVIKEWGKEGKQIMLVGGKNEAKELVKKYGESMDIPYVNGRWIGGTLTNWGEIKKRIEKYLKLTGDKEKGLLAKYTKKERLLIDREISRLDELFHGVVSLKELPSAIIIIDPKKEKTAVREARDKNIPVVAVMNTDCDIADADYPIIANESSKSSIDFVLSEISRSWKEGKGSK